ncbi:MAG: aldehyde dehydrogenase family protein, partial [Sphingomonadales bacterium]|nr:aldehyde dehydrogenase family protein [Sphingomonadales bacterium]
MDKVGAHGRDVGARPDQITQPQAVVGISDQDAADESAFCKDELAINPRAAILHHRARGPHAAATIAGREYRHTGDLEVRRQHHARKRGGSITHQLRGQHIGLGVRRFNQSIGDAAVLGTFADRMDARYIGCHVIVDNDADLDEAVVHIIDSAFGYQGQKCSAASRVILSSEVHDRFLSRLVDAVGSLKIGPPEDP